MRGAGEEFGSDRGGNLLPLCRTIQPAGPEIIRFRCELPTPKLVGSQAVVSLCEH